MAKMVNTDSNGIGKRAFFQVTLGNLLTIISIFFAAYQYGIRQEARLVRIEGTIETQTVAIAKIERQVAAEFGTIERDLQTVQARSAEMRERWSRIETIVDYNQQTLRRIEGLLGAGGKP